MALTAKTVAALKPRAERYVVWDDDTPGFGALVNTTGRVTFILKYAVRGRQRKLTIGRLGDVTVDQARKKAQAARGMVADGADPQSDRDAANAMLTLDAAWQQFVDMRGPHWRPNTLADYTARYKRLIRPALGNRPVGDIGRADVTRLQHALRATPRAANLTIAILSAFISFARRQGLYPHANPCNAVQRFKERPRERVLSDDELARLGSALAAYDNLFPRAAIQLIALLGTRKSEVLGMRWAEVNLDAGTVRLPETKTGARTVYLGQEALDILRSLPRIEGNPYVIPGAVAGQHWTDLKKPWAAVTDAAGIEGATLHDLRRTFGSRAVSGGADLYMVSKLLGHASVKMTEAAYAFMKDDARAAAAKQISGGMAGVMNSRVGNVHKIGGGQ